MFRVTCARLCESLAGPAEGGCRGSITGMPVERKAGCRACGGEGGGRGGCGDWPRKLCCVGVGGDGEWAEQGDGAELCGCVGVGVGVYKGV